MEYETMGNQQATQTDIGWLAGFIDGEGHIGISTQNKKRGDSVKFDLQVVNTDPGTILKVVTTMRALGANPLVRERVHSKKEWANNWVVTVGKMAHIERILTLVAPHLTGYKRDRAYVMLELIKSRKPKNRSPYDEHEKALVKKFRDLFIGNCGASTTARGTLDEMRRRYSLDSCESMRGASEEISRLTKR